MPTLRALKAALIGPSVHQQHDAILAAITHHEQRRQEVPGIKARISDCRERIRGNESRQVKLNSALRGYAEDPKKWASHDRDTRAELAELRRANEDLTAKIARDEQTLSEIASAALPEVSPAVLGYHREQVEQAQTAVAKIRDALEASRAELAKLSEATDPVIDLRRELNDALARLALGDATADEIEAIESRLAASENVASATGARSQRLRSTVTGLEARLSEAEGELSRLADLTPALQLAALQPEIVKAETRYRDAVADLVQASDGYRALAHILTTIRPEATPAPLPEVIAALRDPGQARLAMAIEREQARLSAMGI